MADQEKHGGQDGVNVQVLLRCRSVLLIFECKSRKIQQVKAYLSLSEIINRPLSDREIVDRTPQVICCSEALREVTLLQNAGGKQLSRTFRFDKVTDVDPDFFCANAVCFSSRELRLASQPA